MIRLRGQLRPYIHAQLQKTSRTGQPLNRPLFWDFPDDPAAWEVTDAFMFGEDYLMAPVTEMGARQRTVYLPAGSRYTNFFTNESFAGGQNVTVDCPLDEFPLFRVLRKDRK